jgi:hypothetical protein
VLVLASDVAAQADLVADVRSGGIPLVLPTDDAAAGALIAALTGLAPHDVRWAASSLVHARALTTILDAVAVEDRASRWLAPPPPSAFLCSSAGRSGAAATLCPLRVRPSGPRRLPGPQPACAGG